MIVLLRGHIRHSFDNNGLYDLMKCIVEKYNAAIYIHTWDERYSRLSYTHLYNPNAKITEDTIYSYFKDLAPSIKKIIVEHDEDCVSQIKGRITGPITTRSCIPALAWKYSWYGMKRILDYIMNEITDKNEYVLNTRFDIHYQSGREVFSVPSIMKFIENKNNVEDIAFVYDEPMTCMENLYISKASVQQKFVDYMNNHMDEVTTKHDENNHEKTVWYVNQELFH